MNTDRLAIFETLKGHLKLYSIESVAPIANVAPATMYNWLSGQTKAPRLDTIIKVANAIGFELDIKRKRTKLRAVA